MTRADFLTVFVRTPIFVSGSSLYSRMYIDLRVNFVLLCASMDYFDFSRSLRYCQMHQPPALLRPADRRVLAVGVSGARQPEAPASECKSS